MEARGWVHLSSVLHGDSEGGLGTSFSGGTRGRRKWEWMEGEPLLAGRQYKFKKKKGGRQELGEGEWGVI